MGLRLTPLSHQCAVLGGGAREHHFDFVGWPHGDWLAQISKLPQLHIAAENVCDLIFQINSLG